MGPDLVCGVRAARCGRGSGCSLCAAQRFTACAFATAIHIGRMRALFFLALAFACAPQHRSNLDVGRIEERERSLGMFRWEPPQKRHVAPEQPMQPVEDKRETVIPSQAAVPTELTFAPGDIARRTALAADWSAHAGPGITGVQVFGAGARGVIAYGEACSDVWLDGNVAPIWGALQQHGFLAVHCQGAVARFRWPRRR